MTLLLASFFAVATQLTTDPPRLLVRTFCVGSKCDAPLQLGGRIGPQLTDRATAGALLVGDEDPLQPCLKWLDRDSEKTIDAMRCAKRTLWGLRNGDAMKEQGYDGYLVFFLKQERDDSVQGHAALLTPSGQVVDSWLVVDAITAAGDGTYPAGRAPADATFLVVMPELGESATRWGVFNIPFHQSFQFAPGRQFFGSVLLTPTKPAE